METEESTGEKDRPWNWWKETWLFQCLSHDGKNAQARGKQASDSNRTAASFHLFTIHLYFFEKYHERSGRTLTPGLFATSSKWFSVIKRIIYDLRSTLARRSRMKFPYSNNTLQHVLVAHGNAWTRILITNYTRNVCISQALRLHRVYSTRRWLKSRWMLNMVAQPISVRLFPLSLLFTSNFTITIWTSSSLWHVHRIRWFVLSWSNNL